MSATTSVTRDSIRTGSRPPRNLARRLLRGPETDPRWARPALLGLVALTALLYLWDLTRNGWANDFYAAAVQAGTKSWKAFFFGSFDSSNFITVDKTPASLWVMELSGRVFGFNQWSMLVPQALEGVASVALLYAAVRRWFGPAAGLVAGLVLALTPVAALMFRFNNPDALLVLLMTAAAYAMVRAVENGRTRWLVFCGVLLGFAFLAKMLQAFLVVPGFAIAYLWAGAPRSLLRRTWQTVVMGAGIIVGAGWWVLIAELTPAADRPYFGGSTNNNILQLAIGYNGLERITGDETGSVGGGGGGGGGSAFGGATGLLRLFHTEFGGQISWLLPAALISLGAMLWVSRRATRTDRMRAAALLWGGWVIVTGLVFSYMSGIIHPYYMVALAPGIGALVGIGATALWKAQLGWAGRMVTAAAVLVTAVCGHTYCWTGRRTGCPWLRWVILVAGVLGAAAVLAGPWLARLMSFRAAGAALGGAGHDRGAGRADRVRAGYGEHRAHRLDPDRGTSHGRVRRRRPGRVRGCAPRRDRGHGLRGHASGRGHRHGRDHRHGRGHRNGHDRRRPASAARLPAAPRVTGPRAAGPVKPAAPAERRPAPAPEDQAARRPAGLAPQAARLARAARAARAAWPGTRRSAARW